MLALRPATPADARMLREWDEEPHIIASDPNDNWQWETELPKSPPWRQQLIAELDGVPFGFLEIIDPAEEEERYWGEIGPGYRAIDIWIGPAAYLGKGYGTRMMRRALQLCFADPDVHTVLIDPLASNEAAIRFYQRLGFRPLERRHFGLDDCLVHTLDRQTYDTP